MVFLPRNNTILQQLAVAAASHFLPSEMVALKKGWLRVV